MNIYEHILLAAFCVLVVAFVIAVCFLLVLWVKAVAEDLRGTYNERD